MGPYTLIRAKRKTIGLYIRDGTLEVRAPFGCPQAQIDGFVESKKVWIDDKIAQSQARAASRKAFSPDYGDTILYRGRDCEIAAKSGHHIGFEDGRFYMPPGLLPAQIKDACIRIYRMLAGQILTRKTQDFAALMKLTPRAVKINNAQKRWGSCSSQKSINFSWRLIMADDSIIDYVVVHELAHLKHMNHAAAFWAVVENVMPDYAARKARLRSLQARLAGEDWG